MKCLFLFLFLGMASGAEVLFFVDVSSLPRPERVSQRYLLLCTSWVLGVLYALTCLHGWIKGIKFIASTISNPHGFFVFHRGAVLRFQGVNSNAVSKYVRKSFRDLVALDRRRGYVAGLPTEYIHPTDRGAFVRVDRRDN